MYDDNITVTGPKGDDEQLAEGIDEVLLLNRALSTAATAARRAGSLLDLAIGASSSSTSSSSSSAIEGGQVECEFLIDPNNPLKVLVLWRTRLPSLLSGTSISVSSSPSSSQSYTEFIGKSTILLSPTTGLVSNLQINDVRINGVEIIETLGTTLAALRRAARSAAQATSSLSRKSSGNPLLDGLLNGIQDVVDAVGAMPSSSGEQESSSRLDPVLYVAPERFWKGAAFPIQVDQRVFNDTSVSKDRNATIPLGDDISILPIDRYHAIGAGQIPVVGSREFVEYAIMHETLRSFANVGLYKLAGMASTETVKSTTTTSEDVRSLFTTDAELVTHVGDASTANNEKRKDVILLRGAGKVADLYRSLALFRDASGGDWTTVKLAAEIESQSLIVSWRSESPLQIEGTDSFVFEPPSATSFNRRLPMSSDGDEDEVAKRVNSYFNDSNDDTIPLKIARVENLQLSVAGVAVDSAWAQSFVSAATRSGITAENSPFPDVTIVELLRSLTKKKSPSTQKTSIGKETSDNSSMPPLSDDAAISFYGILRALHNDIPSIVSVSTTSSGSSIITPADEYLAETVELRGLLGEVLVRGSQNYRRLFGLASSSFRAALQTNTVRLAAKPRTVVEVTSKGTIKMDLILALWVTPPPLPLSGARGQSPGSGSNQGFGAPLKIEVSSEYITDKEGKIREHNLLESRLNGVLTPGDMLTRWIKGLAREEESATKPSAMDSLMDAVSWVRSMQTRK